jgi:hypothetical protein
MMRSPLELFLPFRGSTMRRASVAACVLVLAAPSLVANGAPVSNAPAALVPAPRLQMWKGGTTRLTIGSRIYVRTDDPRDRYAVRLLARTVTSLVTAPAHWRPPAVKVATVIFEPRTWYADAPDLMRSQGYRLRIDRDTVRIQAATAQGRFYAVQTLRQLLLGKGDGVLPNGVVEDYPSLAWRGFSDDISRGQLPKYQELVATLDACAYYKLNTYFLYLEDAYELSGLPASQQPTPRLTALDLRRLSAEARKRHIRLIPVVQTLAHQQRLLARPGLEKLSERPPSGYPFAWMDGLLRSLSDGAPGFGASGAPDESTRTSSMFSPVDPRARGFVKRMLDDVEQAAPSGYVHIGCDRPLELGEGTSRRDVERLGPGVILGRYVADVSAHLRKRWNATTLLYGDPLLTYRDAIPFVPREAIVVDWHYDPDDDFSSIGALHRAGVRHVIASPGLWTWYAMFPHFDRAFENIRQATAAARRDSALGCVVAAWGDGGAENLRSTVLAGVAFNAACSWQEEPTAVNPFLEDFCATWFGPNARALGEAYARLGWQEFPGLVFNGRAYGRPVDIRPRTIPWLGRMERLRDDAAIAARILVENRPRARWHRDELDELDLAARRFGFLARREICLDGLARELAQGPEIAYTPADRARWGALLTDLSRESADIEDTYRWLWLWRSRPEGLETVVGRMEHITASLDSLATVVGPRITQDLTAGDGGDPAGSGSAEPTSP